MSLGKMYEGIAFSPMATLKNNIGAADTVIEVDDVSVFPDAPNLATIGTDESAETIFYSAKTETALSGCVRGTEGVARTWAAGSVIARNFTNYDYQRLIDNILAVEKMEGPQGPVGPVGATGPEGKAGTTGPAGATGAEGLNTWTTATQLAASGTTASVNIIAITGRTLKVGDLVLSSHTSSPGMLHRVTTVGTPGSANTTTTFVANMRGAAGIPGSNAKINGMDVLEIVDGENTKVKIEGNKLSINADIGGIPRGIITMWSGAIGEIPSGWALCDGENGTPNLCDRFIIGAGNTYAVGDTGGAASVTLSSAQMPAHRHLLYDIGTTVSGGNSNYLSITRTNSPSSSGRPSMENTGSGTSHENRPPYYALAYIMKL